MKIAIVCDVLGKENNGTTIAAMNLIRYLKAQGHEVRILCADSERKGEENYFVAPNRSFGKLLDKYVKKVGVTLSKKDMPLVERALDGVDYIHSMLPFALGKQAAQYAKKHNIPISAGFHMQAEILTCYLKLNKLKFLHKIIYKHIYKKFYRYVDAVHFPTDFIRGVFEKNIGRTTCGYVISNGVNDAVRKRAAEKPVEYADKIVISTTGRYAHEKSQDTLLKAVRYSKYRDKIQLILAGQGVKEKYFSRLAAKLPVPPVMKFFSREEIVNVLNYSDLYVHPAEVELEGIACLEAITCGKLTIVSDSPLSATRRFAADERCVFKNRNPKDLARVIDYWLDNPAEKRKTEETYLLDSEKYRLDGCMKKMGEMIEEVYARKTGRA